jgi:poly-gamma-glutamate capsule biosynthesis protein CapA/YwtB (metallophosphatase superfamily)
MTGCPNKGAGKAPRMNRRRFIYSAVGALLAGPAHAKAGRIVKPGIRAATASRKITLFLCGDIMTGRGIDQILPHPGKPHLREPHLRSAVEYVKLAERKSGPIPRPVDFGYIWGDALNEWERVRPDVRIANLETTVTSRGHPAPNRVIHYRMNPENLPCLTEAGLDCLVLANNHAMDFGSKGLVQTLEILQRAGIRTAGAGHNTQKAAAPAIIDVPDKRRVLVFAWGMPSSGVTWELAAGTDRSGVNVLSDLSQEAVKTVTQQVRAVRRPGDVVVASIHWGDNWNFKILDAERDFAHRIIETAGVDVVHGHSSHHVKGIEVFRDRPILYGCGDFLNDYEGIAGHEEFRGDLALMYFPTFDPATGKLERFVMTPTQTHQFRVSRAPEQGVRWLADTLNREGQQLGTRVAIDIDGTLRLVWR